MVSKSICLEVQLNEPLVPKDITLKDDISRREGSKGKLPLNFVETSKERLKEEESSRNLFK